VFFHLSAAPAAPLRRVGPGSPPLPNARHAETRG